MTRRTRKILVVVVVALTLVILPILGGLAYNYFDTLERSRSQVRNVADTVARQVAQVLLVAEAALADVAFDARNGCTPELIREFRNKTIAHPTIQGMGLITPSNYLACTTFGMTEPLVRIDTDDFIVSRGALVWFTPPRRNLYAPGQSFTAEYALKDGQRLVLALAPEVLFGLMEADIVGNGGLITVAMQGVPLAELGSPANHTADDLIETRDVGLYDTTVTAQASRQWALARWRENALVSSLLGALAGGILVVGGAHYARGRFSLASELREALNNKEFEIWYQPVIDLQQGHCAGAEALIRWRHPERDLIPPDLFISMAEDSGIIIPMTRWLMQRVGEDLGPLLKANPGLHIAINLAPAHMSNHGIVEDARTTLGRHGIQPSQILFELTERSLIDDPACREVVKALGDLGTEVAIDDFGTGYSSLAYIDKFKLNYLKVDKAFVSVIGTQSPTVRLTDIIIGMATSLGLKTIAEGVETKEQAQYLRERGVKYAQGWHFSKPLDTDDFLAFVRDNSEPIAAGDQGM